MRVALAAAVLLCCACDVKLNRGPHLPNAPEDSDRAHGGVEIAAKNPPKSRLPLPPPPLKYTEDKFDSTHFMMDPGDSAVPPEVRRLGPEAVAAYLDLLPDAGPPQSKATLEREVAQADTAEAKQTYLRALQLRDDSPKEAIELFKQVIAMLPPHDEYSGKAIAQLARLGLPLRCAGTDATGHYVVNTMDLANARATLAHSRYDVLRHDDGAFTIVICD